MDILVVAEIIALLCLSAACVYLILVLIRLKDVLSGMESNMREVTSRVLPVLDNVEYITARVRSITENVDDQVMMVGDWVSSVAEIADGLVAIERKVQERIEGPILDSVAFVAALIKGVRTFRERVTA